MRNRQRNLRLSSWLMLALMIGSILSPTISLANTVESTTSSEEQTEKTLQTLSSDPLIPDSSGTKPSEISTQSSTEETSTVEFTEDSEITIQDNEEKPKTIVTQGSETIDEHQLLIHEDTTNPQPSIKDQKIQQTEDKVYFSGKLFAGKNSNDEFESKTIVMSFYLQSKTTDIEWKTEKEWIEQETEIVDQEYLFDTEVTLTEKESYSFRYVISYKVQKLGTQGQLIEEVSEQGHFFISDTFVYQPKEIRKTEKTQTTTKEESKNKTEEENEKKQTVVLKDQTSALSTEENSEPRNIVAEEGSFDSLIDSPNIGQNFLEKKLLKSETQGSLYSSLGISLFGALGDYSEQKNVDNNSLAISISGEGSLSISGTFSHYSNTSGTYDVGARRYDFNASSSVRAVHLLYREQGQSTWINKGVIATSSGAAINVSNVVFSGFTVGKTYEFIIGYDEKTIENAMVYRKDYNDNWMYSHSESKEYDASYWTGPLSGGTQDFRIRSAIETPENWTGNNGPNAVFYSPVAYRNGANLSYVVIEYKELGEPDSSFKQVPRDKIIDYSGGVVAYIEGLPANKTYSVRAMVYDPYFKEECYSPTWGEHITKCSSIATPKDITYATVGQANGPTAVFSASVNCQNGTLITNAWMEIKLEGAPDSEFVPVACTKNSSNEAQAQFTNLEPNKKYVIRAYVVDTYYGKIYSPEWATYETFSSTIGKPFDVSVTHKGRKPNSPNPVFYAYVDLKNDTKIEENKVNMQIRLSTQTNESDFVTVPCTLEQPGIVKAEFTGLLPNRIYHIRAFVDDELFGRQWASYWADEYYTTTSKAETPVLEGIDDVSATLKTKVSFYNGSNISNVKTEISSDGGITWANNVSCSLENDDAQATFTGLQPNTRYEVRTYIDDHDYGKQYSPIWGHFTTNYNVYENFHDMSGLTIKREKKSVKKGQQYSPVVQNTFTHNSQAYIYKGWLKESEWDGNSATPMPTLRTGPVDPLTTHNEEVYLIYDLDSNSLRLDEYPNKFDFGNQHRPESYNQIFDLDASKYASTEPTDGFKLRVRDDRATHPGWRLTSTFSQLVGVNNTSDQLVGAKISFGVELNEIQNPGTASETAIPVTPGNVNAPAFGTPVSGNTATLTADGSSLIFLRAPNTKGEGVWDVLIDFDSVKLFVPGGQGSTGEEYQGTIQWDLEDAP